MIPRTRHKPIYSPVIPQYAARTAHIPTCSLQSTCVDACSVGVKPQKRGFSFQAVMCVRSITRPHRSHRCPEDSGPTATSLSLVYILKRNLVWYVYHPGQTSNCKYTRENRAAHTTRPLSPVSARLRTAPFRYMYTDPPDTHTHAHALLSRSLRPKGPHDYPNTPPCTLRPALGATSINDVVADSVAISHLGHSLTTGDAEMPASCHVWPTRSCAGG